MVQNRLMGGSIGLAIVSAVFNRTTKPKLLEVLSVEQFQILSQTTAIISTLSPSTQAAVRQILAEGYNLQIKITVGFAAAQIPGAFLMWRKVPKVAN